MSNDLIDFEIKIKPNECINIHNELADRDELQVVSGTKVKSALIAKVQSKVGKVIEGYDQDDGFIDDTDAIDMSMQVKKLEMEAFRVSLVQKQNASLSKSEAIKGKDSSAATSVSIKEKLESYIDELNKIMAPIHEDFLHRISANKKSQAITITDEMLETISKCIDAKVELETEANPNPPKRKIDQWKKECMEYIYSKCFEVNSYQLTTQRKLKLAYLKYTKKSEEQPQKADAGKDEAAKEPISNEEEVTQNQKLIPTVPAGQETKP